MNRFEQIARNLSRYDLDALLILSGPNRLYATRFPSSAGAVLVTEKESFFFTDSRYIEAARRRIEGAAVEESTRERTVAGMVNDILRGLGAQRLGYEEKETTVAEFERLRGKLHAQMKPASGLLQELRAVKDDWEIRQMTGAQRIAESALTEALNFIRPGRTEREIAAFLQYRMLLGGAEKMSFDPIVVSGPNSSMPHGVPTDRPVGSGEFLTMDFGCVYHGYCSDMTRTVAVGQVSEEMERVYHTVLEAQRAGMELARAGVTGADIHAAGQRVIAGAGYGAYFGHGFGHSLGVEIHESPSAAPGNTLPLPEGTVLSAEPGIYLPGRFGVRIEDVIILRAGGCEDITLAPKALLTL